MKNRVSRTTKCQNILLIASLSLLFTRFAGVYAKKTSQLPKLRRANAIKTANELNHVEYSRLHLLSEEDIQQKEKIDERFLQSIGNNDEDHDHTSRELWSWSDFFNLLKPHHHNHHGGKGGSSGSSSSSGGSSSGGGNGGSSNGEEDGGSSNGEGGSSSSGGGSSSSGSSVSAEEYYSYGEDVSNDSDGGGRHTPSSVKLGSGGSNIWPFVVAAALIGLMGTAFAIGRRRQREQEEDEEIKSHPLNGGVVKRMGLFVNGACSGKSGGSSSISSAPQAPAMVEVETTRHTEVPSISGTPSLNPDAAGPLPSQSSSLQTDYVAI